MNSSQKYRFSILRYRPALPLYARILLCFLLNILLVAAVVFWLLRTHFGVDQNWLLSEGARGRIQSMSTVLVAELQRSPQMEWDEILARTGEAHQVQLALFDGDGTRFAGNALTTPEAVQERIHPLHQPPRSGRFGPGQGQGQGQGQGRRRFFFGSLPDEPERGLGAPDEAAMHASHPKEALRTKDPTAYWFLVRLPGLQRPGLTLVGMTESLGNTGLFFDPKPWLMAAAGVIGASALLWLPFARGLTRSIGQMTRATEEIARGRFDTRVEDKRLDELGRLGTAINSMTERLEGFIAGQKRFMGDVAHELCSPLARMEMGLAILEQHTPETDQPRLKEVEDEVAEMRELVNELLSFSRAGLHAGTIILEPVAIAPLAKAVTDRESTPGQVMVNVPEDLYVAGVPLLLQRALANLIRNALSYGATGSPVEVTAVRHDRQGIVLSVADRGPGVPPDALPKLFDPFFRVDTSRSRETGGSGLGLAIVKSCVESCGGHVTARNRLDGGFLVELHLRPADPPA